MRSLTYFRLDPAEKGLVARFHASVAGAQLNVALAALNLVCLEVTSRRGVEAPLLRGSTAQRLVTTLNETHFEVARPGVEPLVVHESVEVLEGACWLITGRSRSKVLGRLVVVLNMAKCMLFDQREVRFLVQTFADFGFFTGIDDGGLGGGSLERVLGLGGHMSCVLLRA